MGILDSSMCLQKILNYNRVNKILQTYFTSSSGSIYLVIYLFGAVLGLRCCMRAFSSCSEQGLHFVVVRGLLVAVASLCCGSQALGARASVVLTRGLSSCGSQT